MSLAVAVSAPAHAELRALLNHHESPCVSLYQPTHRSFPHAQQNPVRYRNLLRQAEKALRQHYPRHDCGAVLDKLGGFIENRDFWNHATEGLAVLASPAELHFFKLRQSVPERVVVGDSFHVKPLVRALQASGRFQLLALGLAKAKLYEGDRDALDAVRLPGVPLTLEEALGTELTEPYSKVTRSYGAGFSGPAPMHHGHHSRRDERELDRDRFFRVVDRAILEHGSRPSGLPLLLAALPEHQLHFHRISHNPLLAEQGVTVNPDALDLGQLRQAAWQTIEPIYEQELERLATSYGEASARGRASDDVGQAFQALAQGRIGTLILESDRRIPGRVGPDGAPIHGDPADSAADDLLDDLAEGVLRSKGEVVVVPTERMPTRTGLAVLYRF